MRGPRYLSQVVLPSVDIPEKGSYTVPEVAEILGKSTRTVHRYLESGTLVAVAGRIYKIELQNYFDSKLLRRRKRRVRLRFTRPSAVQSIA